MSMTLSHPSVWKEDDMESFLSYFNASELWLKAVKDVQRMVFDQQDCEQAVKKPLYSSNVVTSVPNSASVEALASPFAVSIEATQLALAAQRQQIRDKQMEKEINAFFKVTMEHQKKRDKLLQEAEKYREAHDRKEKINLAECERRRAKFDAELKDILVELSLRKSSTIAKIACKQDNKASSGNSQTGEDVIKVAEDHREMLDSAGPMPDSLPLGAVCNASDNHFSDEQQIIEFASSLLLGPHSHQENASEKKSEELVDMKFSENANKSRNETKEGFKGRNRNAMQERPVAKQFKKSEGEKNMSENRPNHVRMETEQKKAISSSFGSRCKENKLNIALKVGDLNRSNVSGDSRMQKVFASSLSNSQKDVRNSENKNSHNFGSRRQRKARQLVNNEISRKESILAENQREAKNYANQMTKYLGKDASKFLANDGSAIFVKKPNHNRRKKQK